MPEEMNVALREGSEIAQALGNALRVVGRLIEPKTKVKLVDDGFVLQVALEALVC